MSRWIVGMSGDKDLMIEHLKKCEKKKLEAFADIREIANNVLKHTGYPIEQYKEYIHEIISLCDLFIDRRSDKQKMQDEIDGMKKMLKKVEGDSECGCC